MRVTITRDLPTWVQERYPGRTGVVLRENPFGQDDISSQRYGGLWYVRLDPTARAKSRDVLMRAAFLVSAEDS